MDIQTIIDRYRFLQKVVFPCRVPVNLDNKGITLKVFYQTAGNPYNNGVLKKSSTFVFVDSTLTIIIALCAREQ
jgi:hypothetical protein